VAGDGGEEGDLLAVGEEGWVAVGAPFLDGDEAGGEEVEALKVRRLDGDDEARARSGACRRGR
jgi:hypothetical protein